MSASTSVRITTLHDLYHLVSMSGRAAYVSDLLEARQQLLIDDELLLAQSVNTLHTYLEVADPERAALDKLALELACFIPGKYRGIHPPLSVLSPRRGGFSASRLRQSTAWLQQFDGDMGWLQALSEERWLRLFALRQFVPSALAKELAGLVQQVLTLSTPLDLNHTLPGELRQHYQFLPQGGAANLTEHALTLWNSNHAIDREIAEQMLLYLAVYHPHALTEFQAQLLVRRAFYRGILFRSASSTTVRTLIDLLKTSIPTETHLLLKALVWIDDTAAIQQFDLWSTSPPSWWRDGTPDLLQYLQEAGWTLTDGERKALYFQQCYALVPTSSKRLNTTHVWTRVEHDCPWCEHPLAALLDLDLTDPRLHFLHLSGKRLRILTCLTCVPWSILYGEVDFEGAAAWSTHNPATSPLPKLAHVNLPLDASLTLAGFPRNPYEGAFLRVQGQSQVGGFPTHLHDKHFPDCPGCHQPMTCIGQVQLSDIEPREGWIYGYLCMTCRVTATVYAQT